MKSIKIIGGHFTAGTDEVTGRAKAGNYFARTAQGISIIVPKELMNKAGWTENAQVPKELHCIYNTESYSTRTGDDTYDEDKTFDQHRASFVSEDINAIDDLMMSEDIDKLRRLNVLQTKATAIGLSPENVTAVVTASIGI